MNKKILIVIILLIIPLVSAIDPSYYYKKGDLINLKVPCFYQNTYCTNSTGCQITIILPNSSILINNQLMTYNPNYFSYQLTSDQTQIVGNYQTVVNCEGEENGHTLFSFFIADENLNFGSKNIIDYKVFIMFGMIAMILFIVYYFKKNIVLGYASATIFLIVAAFMWIYGINIPLNLALSGGGTLLAYNTINSVITGAIGTVIVLISIWLFFHASFLKKEEQKLDVEYREED